MEPNHPIRNTPASVTNGLAAMREGAALNSPVRFPAEDGGRTLAEMAQRDLDAALQLLADRAQFITGASGAAIALRRDGANGMLCRASAGPIAPELGALLSTEFGLSGESVRTRQLLRCDDATRDARVNQEACRHLGIASVVVMPVVNDDEVLGVFELFSGQANAFDDRDLSAVQRLTEMVETAVRLANASINLPKRLEDVPPPVEVHGEALEKERVAEKVEETKIQQVKVEAAKVEQVKIEETSGEIVDEDILLDASETPAATPPGGIAETVSQPSLPSSATLTAPSSLSAESARAARSESPDDDEIIEVTPVSPQKDAATKQAAAPAVCGASGASAAEASKAKAGASVAQKPLFWSAAMSAEGGSEKTGEADQSHVPPVLRGLRKCEACGFPISGGRTLCVECEEKKWRGQLPRAQAAMPTGAIGDAASRKPDSQAFAAAAHSVGTAAPVPVAGSAVAGLAAAAKLKEQRAEPKEQIEAKIAVEMKPAEIRAESPAPELVLSAALEPPQSWLVRNKYIVGVVLAVVAVVTAVILLR